MHSQAYRFREDLKDSRPFEIKCFDKNCVADHSESNYCIHENSRYGLPLPEAVEGLGAAVIASGSHDPRETSETPVEPIDIEKVKKLTEAEKAWKRWTDSWLEGINYKTEVKPRTGRRLFRNNRAGDGKLRQLPRVRGCGHVLDLKRQPRHRNCKSCWTAFFRNQDEMSENIAKIIVEQGAHRVSETFGIKFLQRFHEYCKLVERMEALRIAYAEENKNVSNEFAIDSAAAAVQSVGGDAEASIEVG